MGRDNAYLSMLSASASMQYNMAIILEAKALEAEKARNWICGHLSAEDFDADEQQLRVSIQIHDQIVEVIEGITKYNQGLVAMLRAMQEVEDDDMDASSSFSAGRRD